MGHLTTFGAAMPSLGGADLVGVFRELQVPPDRLRIVVPHSGTNTGWSGFAVARGVEDRRFHVYNRCGNVGPASVPTGIALAVKEGRFERGDVAAARIASGGMPFAPCSFTY